MNRQLLGLCLVSLLVAPAAAQQASDSSADRQAPPHVDRARDSGAVQGRGPGGDRRAWWRPVADRGWLGIQLASRDQARAAYAAEELTESWMKVQNLEWVAESWDGEGVLIQDVFADTPAERAGLLPGDVILSFNGIRTVSAAVLVFVVQRVVVGYDGNLDVLRDGERRPVLVEVGLHPEDARRAEEEREAARQAGNADGTTEPKADSTP